MQDIINKEILTALKEDEDFAKYNKDHIFQISFAEWVKISEQKHNRSK